MGRLTTRRRVTHIGAETTHTRPDTLAVEEPLELRVDSRALTVTMRTPGDDIDLIHGFLLTEGIVVSRDDILAARYCAGAAEDGTNTYNVIDVTLRPGVTAPGGSTERNFMATSSCGVCGKASLDAVRLRTAFELQAPSITVSAGVLAGLPDSLRLRQKGFDVTGGLHAAALCRPDGTIEVIREDIGRHNAVDKVIGWALREGRMPLSESILLVSGRVSFELVQKAVMAGIPVLAAVSAPSSLAVDLAAEAGVTVVGFLRGNTMNVYTAGHRIRMDRTTPQS